MLTPRLNFILALIISVSTMSCSFNRTFLNLEEDKNDAEKVTRPFFESLKHKNYDSAMSLISNKFFEVTSKDKLQRIFEMTNQKLGNLKTTSLSKWETSRTEGTNTSATYALQYTNTYDSAQAIETIRLSLEKDNKIKILGYNINSDAFLK